MWVSIYIWVFCGCGGQLLWVCEMCYVSHMPHSSVDTRVSVVSRVGVSAMPREWYVSVRDVLCESYVTCKCRYTCKRSLTCGGGSAKLCEWYVSVRDVLCESYVTCKCRYTCKRSLTCGGGSAKLCEWYVRVSHVSPWLSLTITLILWVTVTHTMWVILWVMWHFDNLWLSLWLCEGQMTHTMWAIVWVICYFDYFWLSPTVCEQYRVAKTHKLPYLYRSFFWKRAL